MFRACRLTIHLPFAVLLGIACAESASDSTTAPPGEPIPGLTEGELGRFLFGKAVFDRLTTPEEGLGPLFNEPRCFSCHDRPSSGGGGGPLVLKATRFTDGSCDLLEAEGGDNIQRRATPLLMEHGIQSEQVPVNATATALVTAPSLYGLGLVEALSAETIRARADPDDADNDGVSGRVGTTSDGTLGRFGRKSEIATIFDFVDTALRFELGLTTATHPIEENINGMELPSGTDPMPEPEIDERGMRVLTDYIQFLAAPPRAIPETASGRDSVSRGETVFEQVGCSVCHVSEMRTGAHPSNALSGKRVPLYSDLLLHDMGPGLGDVCGEHAAPAEYRTARLWGLRYRSVFLHDGRAGSTLEAIALHGGEATGAVARFQELSPAEKADLLAFLSSL